MMNRAITLAFVPLAFCFSPKPEPGPEPQTGKPNIVFALIDDLGWSNTEYGGSSHHDS